MSGNADEHPSDEKLQFASDGNYYDWLKYRRGQPDINGHVIDSIHARCPDFVIYFCKDNGLSDLYYECTDKLLETTAVANACLAQINRLVSDEEKKRRETLECVADAFEMLLCGQKEESEAVLKDTVTQLEVWHETVGRLYYQSAALFAAILVWILYLSNNAAGPFLRLLDPWLLAAALGATGGFFSVCLNLDKIKVNVNQSLKTLYYAGATRAAVALIAAVACLLAVRGKIILGLAAMASADTAAKVIPDAVLFFLFLAGFSETFITNVLRDSEQNAAAGEKKTPPPPAPPAAVPPVAPAPVAPAPAAPAPAAPAPAPPAPKPKDPNA